MVIDMMICAWAGQPCHNPDCENCAVRERERNIRNIDKPSFIFCLKCVKAMECEKALSFNIDGCNEGVAYYEDL